MSDYKRPEWVDKAPAQYQDILEKHDMWVKDIEGGKRADLWKADLREANLQGANLREADLQGANLEGSNLQEANLQGTKLWRTKLWGANLQGADLREADLRGANLYGVDLRGADLREVNFYGANLYEADLRGADLHGADLDPIKKDLFDVLLRAIPEIPLLKQAIVNGEINGSTYKGECACLCGTIEKSGRFGKICNMRDSSRPIERFFMAINPGDTPENSQFSKLALQWIEEFEGYINVSRET